MEALIERQLPECAEELSNAKKKKKKSGMQTAALKKRSATKAKGKKKETAESLSYSGQYTLTDGTAAAPLHTLIFYDSERYRSYIPMSTPQLVRTEEFQEGIADSATVEPRTTTTTPVKQERSQSTGLPFPLKAVKTTKQPLSSDAIQKMKKKQRTRQHMDPDVTPPAAALQTSSEMMTHHPSTKRVDTKKKTPLSKQKPPRPHGLAETPKVSAPTAEATCSSYLPGVMKEYVIAQGVPRIEDRIISSRVVTEELLAEIPKDFESKEIREVIHETARVIHLRSPCAEQTPPMTRIGPPDPMTTTTEASVPPDISYPSSNGASDVKDGGTNRRPPMVIEVPREIIKIVKKPELREIEEVVEISSDESNSVDPDNQDEAVEPRPKNNTGEIIKLICRDLPTVVSQTHVPTLMESTHHKLHVEARRVNPVVVPVDVYIPKPVLRPWIAQSNCQQQQHHRVVRIPAAHHNALLQRMNPHLTQHSDDYEQLERYYIRDSYAGPIPVLANGHVPFVASRDERLDEGGAVTQKEAVMPSTCYSTSTDDHKSLLILGHQHQRHIAPIKHSLIYGPYDGAPSSLSSTAVPHEFAGETSSQTEPFKGDDDGNGTPCGWLDYNSRHRNSTISTAAPRTQQELPLVRDTPVQRYQEDGLLSSSHISSPHQYSDGLRLGLLLPEQDIGEEASSRPEVQRISSYDGSKKAPDDLSEDHSVAVVATSSSASLASSSLFSERENKQETAESGAASSSRMAVYPNSESMTLPVNPTTSPPLSPTASNKQQQPIPTTINVVLSSPDERCQMVVQPCVPQNKSCEGIGKDDSSSNDDPPDRILIAADSTISSFPLSSETGAPALKSDTKEMSTIVTPRESLPDTLQHCEDKTFSCPTVLSTCPDAINGAGVDSADTASMPTHRTQTSVMSDHVLIVLESDRTMNTTYSSAPNVEDSDIVSDT